VGRRGGGTKAPEMYTPAVWIVWLEGSCGRLKRKRLSMVDLVLGRKVVFCGAGAGAALLDTDGIYWGGDCERGGGGASSSTGGSRSGYRAAGKVELGEGGEGLGEVVWSGIQSRAEIAWCGVVWCGAVELVVQGMVCSWAD